MFKHGLIALALLVLTGAAQPSAQQAAGGGQRPAGAVALDRRARERPAQDRRLLPSLLGRAGRRDAAGDSAVRHRVPVLDRALRRPRIQRYRARSRPGRAGPDRHASSASARACMLVQGNQSFRSSSQNLLERKAVEDSFAKSVLWGFSVAAESGGRVLVDATDFFLRDVHGAGAALRPGNLSRGPHAKRVLPAQHEELREEHRGRRDAHLRQRGRAAAVAVRRRADAGPGTDYRAAGGRQLRAAGRIVLGHGWQRHAHARCGDAPRARVVRRAPGRRTSSRASTIRVPATAASPSSITASRSPRPIQFRYIRRHRLVKKDPAAAISEPVTPIRYWVDSGAPEDVKKALIEGAMWWNQAFEAAGFRNAFQVAVLPDGRGSDGHPLQHDQLGAPLDARLELGRVGDRSAHRRDHQGDGHARLAARSPGLPDLRRTALTLRDRDRAAGHPLRDRARSVSASCRPTKSATRSASATTTTTAPRAGSR